MRLFIDTNIFLDLLLKRDNYKDSLKTINSIVDGKYEAVVLDITILNIDYVAKKQVKNIRDFLKLVTQYFVIIGATNIEITQALELKNSDLEDNLQYISALKSSCDIIISNDKNFYSHKLEVLTSSIFNKRYLGA
jgi:predicted nucleic acid-binding protein